MSALAQFILCFVVLQMSAEIFAANQCSGNLCDQLTPRSCLDHLKRCSTSEGNYKIYNENDNCLYSVYCDMVPETAAAWTLVESFALSHKDEDPFRKHPFKTNAPVNKKSANFNRYRMSQPQMSSLKSVSTHWRATCSFPIDGIDGRDQARANFQDFDIMTFLGNGAMNVSNALQDGGQLSMHTCSQHIDSSHGGCQFVPTAGAVAGEDNFGFPKIINPNFRCHENVNSTTNWWFGGYQCS
ncbi:Hypothetical predicted protein [Paramuricea clavata]|uniref:Uncharacterized protein n=1 Tax=Paramuricea clavata TaxID=317549 RepID=A0A6S7G8U2_PARCT|nr:Hypothetical predicted protein [Paramuricea clavata]